MRWKKDEPRERRASALGLAVAFLLFSGLFDGCANPGPPRPPSLQLPSLVDDLAAERVGDRVLLRWTTPSQTTDKLDIKGLVTAEICRSTGTAVANTKKSLAACATVKRVSVAPGMSTAYDDLPQPLLADPVALLTYRIEIFNASNRSAGKSVVTAYAAAGATPPPVVSLTATASEAGAILKWNNPGSTKAFSVDLFRTDLSAPVVPTHKTSPASALPARQSKSAHPSSSQPSAANEVHLRAAAVPAANSSEAGTVDTTAVMGQTYSYIAQQVRLTAIDGHPLEIRSLPAPAVTLAMKDTFPPKPPAGLATIPGTMDTVSGTTSNPYIDLSWEPNSEPDLAGYLVYRQLERPNGDPEGPLGKMTPLPIAAPSYRDVAVAPGQRYIYTVTAVDASENESAPSAKAQEVAAAQNVGSPH